MPAERRIYGRNRGIMELRHLLIAERLVLAEKTVKNYVSTLLGKLGVESRTQAAVLAARRNQARGQADDG